VALGAQPLQVLIVVATTVRQRYDVIKIGCKRHQASRLAHCAKRVCRQQAITQSLQRAPTDALDVLNSH